LHFKTVHYGHMQVQHDAVGPMGRHRFEQLGTGRKGFHVHAGGAY